MCSRRLNPQWAPNQNQKGEKLKYHFEPYSLNLFHFYIQMLVFQYDQTNQKLFESACSFLESEGTQLADQIKPWLQQHQRQNRVIWMFLSSAILLSTGNQSNHRLHNLNYYRFCRVSLFLNMGFFLKKNLQCVLLTICC